MTEQQAPEPQLRVVRGEMRPWTDARPAPGGPVVVDLVRRVLDARTGGRVLVLGPHAPDVLDAVQAAAPAATVLLRSFSDATELLAARPGLDVVTGALDGLVQDAPPPYDVVLAVDGLDRVLGTDSPDLDWSRRLGLLATLCAAGAAVVLRAENPHSVTTLLDARPPRDRYGDEEWVPLRSDLTRPATPAALADAVDAAGLGRAQVHGVAGPVARPVLVADAGLLATAAPGGAVATAVAVATEVEAAELPLLAAPDEALEAAARSGTLALSVPAWFAVRGAELPSLLVARGDAVVEGHAAPDALSVEERLLRAAEAEDVPAFRGLLEQVGTWARTEPAGLDLRDLYPDGTGFVRGVLSEAAPAAGAAHAVAAALWQLHERLVLRHRRHPWPPWMVGERLVSTWLAMAGFDDPEVVRRAQPAERPPAVPSVQDVLAELAERQQEVTELLGHVAGLERTLTYRDKQLRVRADRIRELRRLTDAAAAAPRDPRSKLRRRLALVRHPRKLAGAVRRRARRALAARRS